MASRLLGPPNRPEGYGRIRKITSHRTSKGKARFEIFNFSSQLRCAGRNHWIGNVALGDHLPGWQRRSGFLSRASIRTERWKLLKEALPAAATYSSIADLPPDLQFIDICTPPHTHFEIAASALKRGWNVLCEKPLVLTEEQFHELRRLATERNLVLFTVHNWKFAPICRQITDLIRAGSRRNPPLRRQVMRDGPSRHHRHR
jgi:predicted dehydrogenase